MKLLLIYILVGLVTAVSLSWLWRLFKVKAWLHVVNKGVSSRIGFSRFKNNDEIPEVHSVDNPRGAAIGRVLIGDNDDNAYIEMLTTDVNDESVKPLYKSCGYISSEGIIYYQRNSRSKPEKIGYTARPSNPNEPTISGERLWKTLWTKCVLNAYSGVPNKDGKKKKIPDAVCYFISLRSAKQNGFPLEARGAAFSFLYRLKPAHKHTEYYGNPVYGWKDTALLASFIYAILYLVMYFLNTNFFGMHIFDYSSIIDAAVLYGFYYAIWALVRSVKVGLSENSNSFQSRIDLFNKTLGQKFFGNSILVCCAIILAFTMTLYDYDFVALALAISTGIAVNKTLKSSSERWVIENPFSTDDDNQDDDLDNPEGDITRSFEWELDSETTKGVKGSITLYFDSQYISDLRYANPFYCQRSDKSVRMYIIDMINYMNEHGSITKRLRYVASEIKRIAVQNGITDEKDLLQFALDFVQEGNIRFCMNRDSRSINQFEDYIRYPDEVLYDKEADSNSKALLSAMLFHYMGHNVVFLMSRVQRHGAIGIEFKDKWIVEDNDTILGQKKADILIKCNNRNYVFCETTSDGFRIGGTMEGMRASDFDEIIEIPVDDLDLDLDQTENRHETRMYNWDLDSLLGNKLHGNYTLEFNSTDIDDLRENNPFRNYGQDGNTYEDNIRTIFDYIGKNSERTEKIHEIASYIKKTVKENALPELDMIQFALDFCQEPNLKYVIDEESDGIGRAKEYMRFPDEVLFDKEGDCDCKSSLTASLFHELGYNVVIMLSEKQGHAAVGIESKDEWIAQINCENINDVQIEHNGKKYLYCETTGDGFKIGHIEENKSIKDFETIIEINT